MRFLLRMCFALLIAGYASAQCPASLGWTSVSTNKCMMCGSGGLKNYADARAACKAASGDLASILNAGEETFANGCSVDLSATAVYMGLTMRANGTTGTPSNVLGWLDGSPETVNAVPNGVTAAVPTTFTETCFEIKRITSATGALSWADAADCTVLKHYVCSRAHVTCPAITAPADSTVAYDSTGTSHYPGSIATYTCSTGYDVVGTSTTRTCQDDGTWSVPEPLCSAVDCGPVAAPANGHVTTATTTYNSVATHSCNTGYTLGSSSPSRICQADGNWTGSALSCTEVSCGTPAAPENGAVSAPTTTYGHQAAYSCNSNYNLQGSATRTCMATGSWSGADPTCDNTLAIALGASFGGLAAIGIIAGLIYFLSRAVPAGSAMRGASYARPAPYRRTPGYPRPGPPRGPMPPRGRPVPRRPY